MHSSACDLFHNFLCFNWHNLHVCKCNCLCHWLWFNQFGLLLLSNYPILIILSPLKCIYAGCWCYLSIDFDLFNVYSRNDSKSSSLVHFIRIWAMVRPRELKTLYYVRFIPMDLININSVSTIITVVSILGFCFPISLLAFAFVIFVLMTLSVGDLSIK